MVKRFVLFMMLGVFVVMPLNAQAKPPQQTDFQPYEEVWRLGKGYFTDMEWHPSGEVMAMSTSQGIGFYNQAMVEIDFWEINNSPSAELARIAWSPDGRYLATTRYNDELSVWSYPSREKVASYSGELWIEDIAWQGDSQKLGFIAIESSASYFDSPFYLWDIEGIQIEKITQGFQNVVWNDAQQSFFLWGSRQGIQQVDPEHSIFTTILSESLHDFAISPDGKFIVISTREQTQVLDLKTNQIIETLEGYYEAPVWNNDSTAFVMTNRDTLFIWDSETYQIAYQIQAQHSVEHPVWHPDGKTIICHVSITNLSRWDIETASIEMIFNSDENLVIWANPEYRPLSKNILTWRSDSEQVAIIHGQTVGVWDVSDKKLILQTPASDEELHWITWNPAYEEVLGTTGNQVYLWSTATGELLNAYDIQSLWVAWSPDGESFASTSYDERIGYINIRDKQTSESLQKFRVWGQYKNVEWTPDGTQIVGIREYETRYIQVWDVATGDMVNLFSGYGDVALSPTGTQLAIELSDWTYIHDYKTGVVQNRLPSGKLAWHPDGEILTISGRDSKINLWDVATGKILQTLARYQYSQLTLSFSPDGRYLVSAGNGLMRMWKVVE